MADGWYWLREEIHLDHARGGATCAEARAVMRSVAGWADSTCYRDLRVRRHRENAGFRCSIVRDGDADWEITCRGGRKVVTGHSSL